MTLTAMPLPGLDPLLQSGVIAVVRVSEAVRLGPAARALAAGGVGAGGGTPTTPGAIDTNAHPPPHARLAGGVIRAGAPLGGTACRSKTPASGSAPARRP